MVQTLRNISAVKIKGQGTIAPGGIWSCGTMNDGTWAGGGFRITNTTGANTGDLGVAAGLVTGTSQGFVLSNDVRYALVRSNNSGFQTGVLKKANAIGNFGASLANIHTAAGLGVSAMYMGAAAWMSDNRHFWISGPATNSVTAGISTMWLCRYDPDTNTVVLVDTYDLGGGATITQMILSPDGQRLLVLNNASTSDGFVVLVLGTGYRVRQRINTTGSTQSVNTAFWHPRLNLFGYTQFVTSAPLVLKRWNGTSYVDVSAAAVPAALTRGGGFLFSGRVLWLTQGTNLRLYDLATDGTALTANATITPPTITAATTENPKYRSQDDLATQGLFQTATGAFILTSNDLSMKGDFVTPGLAFAGNVGVEAAGELHPVFPTLNASIEARRNEYFALDAQFPKMQAESSMHNYYGILDAVAPKMLFNSTVFVLDEPYEPFEGRYYLSLAPVAVTAESGSASGEDAGQFAYTLGWDFPLMQADIMGSQDAEVTASFVAPKLMTADITMGAVPEFTGDFITPKLAFAAFSALYPVGNLEAIFPSIQFDAEGLLPSDISILDATFTTLVGEFDVLTPPGGFIEAEFPVTTFDAEGIVPYGVYADAILPTLAVDANVNVPLGVLVEAEFTTLDGAFDVMVPTYADLGAEFPSMNFEGAVNVPVVGALEAAMPLMQADVDAIFMYDATMDATFPTLEFSGEPPLPVDADLHAEFAKLEADLFGGPMTLIDFEPTFPNLVFDGRTLMGPRIDANIRFTKLEAAIVTKFVITGTLDAQFPVMAADLFGGPIIEAELDAQFPSLLFRGALRVGDDPIGAGDAFTVAYTKRNRRGRAFAPIKAGFG